MRKIVVVVAAVLACAASVQAEPLTKVYINGLVTPVYFNDGDSFRPQAGPLKGQQSRLAGFNTLESQGPVHRWGTFDPHELYVNAKTATLMARRGVWHCETDGKKDGYGRMLIFCKDLDATLIRAGLAHAYSVDQNPGDPDLIAAEREAMKERRGMWAHGIPRFVMTSIHSKNESEGHETSNRLISTFDAHTQKWVHDETYKECQWVCEKQPWPTPQDLVADVAAVQDDAPAHQALDGLSPDDQRALVDNVIDLHLRSDKVTADDYAIFEPAAPAGVTPEKIAAVLEAVKKIDADKKLAVSDLREDSCFLYVDFHRRYGADRASCLK